MSDQHGGSAWTGAAAGWTTCALLRAGPRVVERLWRSVRCERVHLHAFETGPELRGLVLDAFTQSGEFVARLEPTFDDHIMLLE